MAAPSVFDSTTRWRGSQGNFGAINQTTLTVANSQNINKNDIVTWSSGLVQQAIALPGSNNTGTASGGNTTNLGIAMAPIITSASGVEAITGRTQIPVAIFDHNLQDLFRMYDATAANTVMTAYTLGTKFQFQRWRGANASQWWYSLILTTTNGEFLYVEPGPDQSNTDTYPLIWVRAVGSLIQA